MSDEIKKPEEITDVPLPEKELSAEDLNTVTGGSVLGDIVRAALAPAKQPTESITLNFTKIQN